MDNEMIERCAKALVNSIKENDFSDHDLYMMGEEGYIAVDQILIKAVIKAMLEPTEKMKQTGINNYQYGSAIIYRQMLGAVINE